MHEAERVANKFRNHISGAAQYVILDSNDFTVDQVKYALHQIDEIECYLGMQVIGVDCTIECQFAMLTPHVEGADCVVSHFFTGRILETSEVIQTAHAAMRMYPRCDYAVAFATELAAFVEQMNNFDPMAWLNEKTFWLKEVA